MCATGNTEFLLPNLELLVLERKGDFHTIVYLSKLIKDNDDNM